MNRICGVVRLLQIAPLIQVHTLKHTLECNIAQRRGSLHIFDHNASLIYPDILLYLCFFIYSYIKLIIIQLKSGGGSWTQVPEQQQKEKVGLLQV